MVLWGLFLCSACGNNTRIDRDEADRLNHYSYASRYKNLEECRITADSAKVLSEKANYPFGICEAICNETFYAIARMQYAKADTLLHMAEDVAPDNVSKLAIEVLRMRLCQRRSQNKDFFLHKFHAERLIGRIENNLRPLNDHQLYLFRSVRSSYGIILSTYLYYMGNDEESERVLHDVSPAPVFGASASVGANHHEDACHAADTAQWLAYLYNVGSYNDLIQCYILSSQYDYPYWEANSLQSLSEYLMNSDNLDKVRHDAPSTLRLLNEYDVPDTLISHRLAEKALEIFVRYGDLYQSAAAWRTLADSHERNGDYDAMLNCLLAALSDTLVLQSPTIISSIDARLSIAYSALDNKPMADLVRNEYLDIQDSIRQDRQLEARADELHSQVMLLQVLVTVITVVLVIIALVVVYQIRFRKKHNLSRKLQSLSDDVEEMQENVSMLQLQISDAQRQNIEQRAKIFLIQSMQPLIDRMQHAVTKYTFEQGNDYLDELCTSVSEGNALLTQWIQLRKGSVKLRIESFPIRDLFDIISLNAVSLATKGVTLHVEPSDCIVKADRTLTLFLLNTLVDNARKFTDENGIVTVTCLPSEDVEGYADISVGDTGKGMTQEDADHLFEYRVIEDNSHEDLKEQKSHGFGLMNCRGIIDRYRKSSNLFAKTTIFATSEVGKGTKITFRLPLAARMLLVLIMCVTSLTAFSKDKKSDNTPSQDIHLVKANAYCDSMYYCNVNARYADCLMFADSCRHELNLYYLSHTNSHTGHSSASHPVNSSHSSNLTPSDTLTALGDTAEILWWEHGFVVDYDLILAMRNEAAVASLALHKWDSYRSNNDAYRSLYLLTTADNSLDDYCAKMERYEGYSNLILILLFLISLLIVWSFYRYYIRDFMIARNDYRRQISDMEDQLGELQSEYDRLYIANSISENCLSTIKHETMYYPSRIATLITTCKTAIDEGNELKYKKEYETLCETISYYRILYALLSQHCQRLLSSANMTVQKESLADIISQSGKNVDNQVADDALASMYVLINYDMFAYLMLLLKRKNGDRIQLMSASPSEDGAYVMLDFLCDNLHLTEQQVSQLFLMSTHDVDYLTMKQILRDIGALTIRHACGITASLTDTQSVTFRLLLPRQR